MAIMVAIFGPLLPDHGISIFVLVFTSWVSGTAWNTSYMNPATTGLISLADRALDYNTAQKGSYAYSVINLIAMTASVPLWHALGMC
jgi:DASS family divalent anion:Na+ symporter